MNDKIYCYKDGEYYIRAPYLSCDRENGACMIGYRIMPWARKCPLACEDEFWGKSPIDDWNNPDGVRQADPNETPLYGDLGWLTLPEEEHSAIVAASWKNDVKIKIRRPTHD